MKTKRNYKISLYVLLLFVISGTAGTSIIALAKDNAPKEVQAASASISVTADTDLARLAVDKIKMGQFEAAGELLESSQGGTAVKLKEIIAQQKDLKARREQAKIKQYEDNKAELEKLKQKLEKDRNTETSKLETLPAEENKDKLEGSSKTENEAAAVDSDVDHKDEADKEEDVAVDTKVISDADIKVGEKASLSEPNQIADAFAAILKVHAYANAEQKKELLEDEFVKLVIEKSLEQSRKDESQGKWIDAYASSYYWLTAMFPENEQYKNHSQELTDKALIQASLMDTPCETSEERHEGILPTMLVRTIRVLDLAYVSVIDYDEMAIKALDRCELLAEVLLYDNKDVEIHLASEQVTAWNKGLREIKKNVEESLGGIDKNEFIDLFLRVLKLNLETIQVPQEVLVEQFTEAALATLDPYTNLIWPWQVKDFQKSMTQQFTGIGIEISKVTGELKVVSLIPDTPAYNSGLDAEDIIVKINGEETKEMSIDCAVKKITGPAGTDVELTVRHTNSTDTVDIKITRANIDVPTIRGWTRDDQGKWEFMVDQDNKVGYIRVTGFTANTAMLMKKALAGLEADGMKSLIVDLRNNSGGYLDTAAELVDMFVDEGVIVSTRPRLGLGETLRANKKATLHCPLVVLINGASASASEIVAGALSDTTYERATLVGTRSYGKGSVQTISGYPADGAQLKYTMAFYYLPSGQRVANRYQIEKQGRKDWGIAPHVEVELTGEEFKKAYEYQKDNDVLVNITRNHNNGEFKKHTAQEIIESDPQLETAILVLRSQMAVAKDAD